MRKQPLPKGVAHSQLSKIAKTYETQTEAEAVAEDEAAFAGGRYTMLQIPTTLVEEVRQFVAKKVGSSSKTASAGGELRKVSEKKAKYPAGQ